MNKRNEKARLKHLNTRRQNKNGAWYTITNYVDSTCIEITFDNGVVKQCNLSRLNIGDVSEVFNNIVFNREKREIDLKNDQVCFNSKVILYNELDMTSNSKFSNIKIYRDVNELILEITIPEDFNELGITNSTRYIEEFNTRQNNNEWLFGIHHSLLSHEDFKIKFHELYKNLFLSKLQRYLINAEEIKDKSIVRNCEMFIYKYYKEI